MAADLDLTQLRADVGGEVIDPAHAGYDEARALWNGVIDRRPAAIARCGTVQDVRAAVLFARANGLTIAVRGGGHQVAGTGSIDDGLVIDLSPMRSVSVDPERRLVHAQGGATLGDIDAASQEHGLAVPLGVVSETGVAGLTLSGGMGYLRRLHGLTCDALVSAEVVASDGDVMTVGEDENAELLWALRGGGGHLCAVTSFTFRAYPVGPDVAFCFVLYPAERGSEILRAADELVRSGPDEIAPLAFYGRVPPAAPFPAEIAGATFVALLAPHPGPPDDGERALRPFRELGEPIADLSDRSTWVEVQRLLDEDYPSGGRYYWTSIELAGLSDDALARMRELAAEAPSDASTVDVWFQGGAMGRVPADATAFGDRSAPILVGVEANWGSADDDEANIAWARRCVAELRPFSTGGIYLNFAGFLEDRDAQLRSAIGDNVERLRGVKAAYDPGDLFGARRPRRDTAV